jgi:hypothetical protein
MDFLRHTLAALAYRAWRAIENAPPEFARFESGTPPRTPVDILAHMGDLMDWAKTLADGKQEWRNSAPLPWDEEIARFFSAVKSLDACLAAAHPDADTTCRLFQGPIADALTHTGQLAMLRRLSGSPIRGENYFVADIKIGCVGIDHPSPRKPFAQAR